MFDASEYDRRCTRLRQSCHERDLDALLVMGRGGGPIDRMANVNYLTGAYPGFPTIPDMPGHWADCGYCAVLVTDSEVILIGEHETVDAVSVHRDRSVPGTDVVRGVATTLTDTGVAAGRIGLAGTDVLTVAQNQRLMGLLPGLSLQPADDLLMSQRQLKSEVEIEAMRAAGRVVNDAMHATMERATAGATEADAAAAASQVIAASGAVRANVFGELWPPRDGELACDRVMKPGDIYTVDISGALRGYYFDLARTKVIDAEPTPAQRRLLDLSRNTVDAVAEALVPGTTIARATRAGLDVLDAAGYDLPNDGNFQALGHGLGLGFELPYLLPDVDDEVVEGMVISVERHCTEGDVSATFERNLVITADGARDLCPVPVAW